VDKITGDLLVLSKSFCLKAEEEFRQKTHINLMLSVMNMQDAVEFCLSALTNDHGISVTFNDKFGEIRKKINDKLQPRKLPLETQIDFLNNARGKVKHHGSIPSEQDAEKCIIYGRDFLESVFRDCFNVDFDCFSLVSLVTDGKLRSWLEQAEKEIAKETEDGYLEALILIKNAYLVASPRSEALLNRNGIHRFSGLLHTGEAPSVQTVKILQAIVDKIALVEDAILPLLSDVNLQELKYFERITPNYQFYSGAGGWRKVIRWNKNTPLTKTATNEALSFALKTILKWQEAGLVRAGYKDRNAPIDSKLSEWITIREEDGLLDFEP
jgi:hypothetical protein